jgi:hypothetical protein
MGEARKKLEELKKAGDAASGELKKGIENALAKLRKGLRQHKGKKRVGCDADTCK